ncbi:hypothetical protein C1N59_20575 (plasmid) [Pantoea sp. SGAir0183]
MTVVITYLAKDNAKARYRARRAAKREQMESDARLARKIAVASTGCSLTVSRAINSPSMRSKHESGSACLPEVAKYAAGIGNLKTL